MPVSEVRFGSYPAAKGNTLITSNIIRGAYVCIMLLSSRLFRLYVGYIWVILLVGYLSGCLPVGVIQCSSTWSQDCLSPMPAYSSCIPPWTADAPARSASAAPMTM